MVSIAASSNGEGKNALAACDSDDGVTDSLINNPLTCKFDPGALLCTVEETDACLTAPQVAAARSVYANATNPRTKEKIFPGMAPGSEVTWGAVAGTTPFPIPVDFYKYFVYSNPEWDWKQFDLDKDVAAGDEKLGKLMNAIDPDLDKFRDRGGKLIMYHGWNDQLIQPHNSIDYYTSVQKKLGTKDTDDFLRLFMAPGMGHCMGGAGPNVFDALTALDQWVEGAPPPDRIVATKFDDDVAGALGLPAKVLRSRPLCAWPKVARWHGNGSSDAEENFICVDPASP